MHCYTVCYICKLLDGTFQLFGCLRLTHQLPYLHWDTLRCFTQRSDYVRDVNNGRTVDIPDRLPDRTKSVYRVMRDYSGMVSSLHPRRSLDQFFYSSLPETTTRDKDQVVSKNTAHTRAGKKMVMVDQLWLWILEVARPHSENHDQTQKETVVFTCFPRKDEEGEVGEEDLQAIADLQQAITDEVNSGERLSTTGSDLVGIILDQAVNVMLRIRNEQSLDFLDVFRAAIGKAVR